MMWRKVKQGWITELENITVKTEILPILRKELTHLDLKLRIIFRLPGFQIRYG